MNVNGITSVQAAYASYPSNSQKATEEKTSAIPFEKENRPSAEMTKGTTKIIQKGINGSKKTTYKMTAEENSASS